MSQGRRIFLEALGLATGLSLLATAGALAFESPADGVYKDRIDWGMTADMSGPASAAQRPWGLGFQAAMRAVNDKGGVNGRKINVFAEDTRYDATTERVLYEKFVSQTPALGTSGMGNSSAQVALVPLIKRAKLPVVGTYTTARQAIDPAFPQFYGGFCGFKEMAQVGIGFFTEHLKLQQPKVALVHLDVASGKEYAGYVETAVSALGGTVKAIPIKVVAADATPQVLEILAMKPDYVAIHGVPTTSILVMKAMQQYGINVPAFAITYLGTPGVYESLGPDAGKQYYFVSCFTPASADPKAAADMVAAAGKYGYAEFKDDINYVAGWTIGNMVAQAIAKVGPEPTREKLADMLHKGFAADTGGLSSELKYTPTDHAGLSVLKPFTFDYGTRTFKAFGEYKDYARFIK
jgi:ABC-type branched-subunit amino acid transport system substrate-binding protein